MKLINSILILSVGLLSGCDPDDPDLTCNGKIKSKDLSGIQNCLRRSWRLNYQRSESNGSTKEILNNSFIDIKSDDSVFYFHEGDLIAITQVEWIQGETGYTLKFKDWRKRVLNWHPQKFSGDSLFILTGEDADIQLVLTPAEFEPTMNCVGSLQYKALDQIRYCILGYWQKHYIYGGFAGDWRFDTPDTYVEFLANDSIYYTVEGNLQAADKIEWFRGVAAYTIDSVFVLKFDDWREYPYTWWVKEIKDDTLVIADTGYDGYKHFLTRKK